METGYGDLSHSMGLYGKKPFELDLHWLHSKIKKNIEFYYFMCISLIWQSSLKSDFLKFFLFFNQNICYGYSKVPSQ